MNGSPPIREEADTRDRRKARGAFFTPALIARFINEWAIRSPLDSVLEPSCGDAAFLTEAVRVLQSHGAAAPVVHGVEIHDFSAREASQRVRAAGGVPRIKTQYFFLEEPTPTFSAVVGNPPFVRYQDWAGEARTRSRAAALTAGVNLTQLSSSWAAFAVHSAMFLANGGRMGLVLPAELLSVNYAASVRSFLFRSFRSVDLVLFNERVFPEAGADVVLLLADGYGLGPTDHATIYQVQNAASLGTLPTPRKWTPTDPSDKWTSLLVNGDTDAALGSISEGFTALESGGDTTLGTVTGGNHYFALSPAKVRELGLHRSDLLRLSPPGSSHLRGLELTPDAMRRLGRSGKPTWLFRPTAQPSAEALAYIRIGEAAGVNEAYKARIRREWWRVPLVRPADLLLTYMNADTVRLTTNSASAHHLNSVHGVYLSEDLRDLGRELLPLASLNSATLLSAETSGRAYGGGILKMEPREADRWAMPSPKLIAAHADALRSLKPKVAAALRARRLSDAVDMVDNVLLVDGLRVGRLGLDTVRGTYDAMSGRRKTRSGARRSIS